MIKIELVDFESLTDIEKDSASNNGCGKECASYIRITKDGECKYLESDAMEPEDVHFTRDLSWILDALNFCYATGLQEGKSITLKGGNQ